MRVASPLEGVLAAALAEYEQGEADFLRRYGNGRTTIVVVDRARRFDAVAVERFLRARLGYADAAWRGDLELVCEAGLEPIPLGDWAIVHEHRWRQAAWAELQRHGGVVSPRWLRGRGIYGAAQGVWVDADRTRSLAAPGIAVSVRHTGHHYADSIDGEQIIYSYPRTDRPGVRDSNEIDAVRNARDHSLPLFVVSDVEGGTRRLVRLAWVIADDPASRSFLMEFAESEPTQLEEHDPPDDAPFETRAPRTRTARTIDRLDRDTTFKFRMLRRYEGRCAISGVDVQEVLDGAHVIDVAKGGSDDARNGLLLTADLHRALDAHLWALHPLTLKVVTRPQGPTLDDLQVGSDRLRPDARRPHPRALEWRYRQFRDLLAKATQDAPEAAG